MPDLTVQIKADLTNYVAGMKQASDVTSSGASSISNGLNTVQATIKKVESEIAAYKQLAANAFDPAAIGNYNNQIRNLELSLVTLRHQEEDLITPIKEFEKSAKSMSSSMKLAQMRSGMSAARDGLIGLTMSGQRADSALMAMGHHFTSLIQETGSVGGAFTALGSSLSGPGGIILGLTLLATLYEAFKKKQDDANKSTIDFLDTLNSIRLAQLKGRQDGENEIVRLKILYDATQNHTLSLKDRNLAYDELEKQYPKFFTNADREKTLLDGNKIAYDSLATSILAVANAKAYEAQIGVNSNRDFENQQKINDLYAKRTILQSQIKKATTDSGGQTFISRLASGEIHELSEEAQKVEQLNKNIKDTQNLYADQLKLRAQNQQLVKMASASEIDAGFKTSQELDDKNEKLKKQATLVEDIRNKIKALQEDILKNPENKSVDLSQIVTLKKQLAELNPSIKTTVKTPKTSLQLLEAQYKSLQDAEAKWIEAGNVADPFNLTVLEHKLLMVKNTIDDIKERTSKGLIPTGLPNESATSVQNIAPAQAGQLTISDSEFDIAKKKLQDLYNLKEKARIQSGEMTDATKAEGNALREMTSVLGGGLTNAFTQALSGSQSFFQSFGQFLVQLIEKLVAAIATAAILAAVLSLTGFGAVMELSGGFSEIFSSLSGISALTSGSSLTNSVIPKHADGGITTRAHLAMVGEGREKEAIMPLSKLQSFVNTNNNGMQHGQIVGIMRGSDLILQYQRASIQKGRIG